MFKMIAMTERPDNSSVLLLKMPRNAMAIVMSILPLESLLSQTLVCRGFKDVVNSRESLHWQERWKKDFPKFRASFSAFEKKLEKFGDHDYLKDMIYKMLALYNSNANLAYRGAYKQIFRCLKLLGRFWLAKVTVSQQLTSSSFRGTTSAWKNDNIKAFLCKIYAAGDRNEQKKVVTAELALMAALASAISFISIKIEIDRQFDRIVSLAIVSTLIVPIMPEFIVMLMGSDDVQELSLEPRDIDEVVSDKKPLRALNFM